MEVSQPLDHITHAVIGGGKTIDFGISNSAEFFDILSRTLYTDQILAVVREVLCNAWDAHIDAGCTDKPIQIKLDSEHFEVRDFGLGIAHANIGPIYGVYGASTKKNDGLQTGGFGLGCKAPFAYTDHFEVVSHHDGQKTIYNMSKSNAVAKGKPGIITIASFPATEQGLRVKMPILGKDYIRFSDLIKRIVSNGEMLAELNGELLPTIPFSSCPHGYLLTTRLIMGSQITKRILLRYGNVIYPIESSEEIVKQYSAIGEFLQRYEQYKLVLQAPPDSISVTPSRESLSMQEHTVNTLNRLFKNFLAYTRGVNDEMMIQGKKLIDAEIAKKNYPALFSHTWGFTQSGIDARADIIDAVGMARHQMTRTYPNTPKFRIADLGYRVNKAAEAKILDPHLSNSFLKELSTVTMMPNQYHHTKDRSDWLHRNVLAKVIVKLQKVELDYMSLFIVDKMQYSYNRHEKNTNLISLKNIYSRSHLINLPFLRKVVVITTAVTGLSDRLWAHQKHNSTSPMEGMLCYYVRTRKADTIDKAFEVFKKLGYEIIDLTHRNTWEEREVRQAAPRCKPSDYAGMPALNNILVNDRINIPAFRSSTAIMLAAPELITVISLRNKNETAIDDFHRCTKAVVGLYGSRCGIAKDQIELKRAIKYGAKPLMETLEAEMRDMLLTSPTVAEYLAYDYKRVREKLPTYGNDHDFEAMSLVYGDEDLRQEFGIKNNLTADEKLMLKIYQANNLLSDDTKLTISTYINTINLGPENASVIAACSENNLLDMLSISSVKEGLKSAKRQIYLDVLTKILKG